MPSILSRRKFLKSLALGTATGAGAAGYAQNCADWLSVEHTDLNLPKWDLDGFKVALLADLHMNVANERERAVRAMRLALAEKPDLVVLVGDFVNSSTPEALRNIRVGLDTLREARCPCIGVMGNHDYWCPHANLVVEAVSDSPLVLLRNKIHDLEGLSIVGIDDAFQGLADFEFFPEDKVARNCLVLLHEPDYVDRVPRHASVQLSGHTHGGQICLPFGIPLKTPTGGKKYISGSFPDAPVPLYVTRGVGTSGPDYRLFCRPEISILTLRNAT